LLTQKPPTSKHLDPQSGTPPLKAKDSWIGLPPTLSLRGVTAVHPPGKPAPAAAEQPDWATGAVSRSAAPPVQATVVLAAVASAEQQ
jgi:hypothetical protein